MTRDGVFRVFTGLLLLAAGAWLVWATEWVEVDVEKPARGEAAKNALYATQALVRGLGARVEKRGGLDAMPPKEARLVLASRHWSLFPERAQSLRAWVQAGGHLVVPAWLIDHHDLEGWIPVTVTSRPAIAPRKATPENRNSECRELGQPETVPAAYPGSRVLRICAPGFRHLQSSRPPLWAANGEEGTELVRVAVGHGSVTVVGPWGMLENQRPLREDNALIVAAALQLRAGAEVWFVVEEAREPFLPWIWNKAWPALMLGLLAVALALWRGGVRFGPRVAPAGTQRRSKTEQILGTAQFLRKHGAASLHRAQLRAFDEAVTAVMGNLAPREVPARARAVAAVTGLDAQALARALDASRSVSAATMLLQLELLESARRRLFESRSRPASFPPSSKSRETHHANQT